MANIYYLLYFRTNTYDTYVYWCKLGSFFTCIYMLKINFTSQQFIHLWYSFVDAIVILHTSGKTFIRVSLIPALFFLVDILFKQIWHWSSYVSFYTKVCYWKFMNLIHHFMEDVNSFQWLHFRRLLPNHEVFGKRSMQV